MPRQPVRVLISGASVAGPMAAYWLCRQGFAVTVVERMPLTLVRTSGHAVELFGPAMDVAEWTGVLPAVTDARTRTEIVSFQRLDGRGVDVDVRPWSRVSRGDTSRSCAASLPPSFMRRPL
jgi:2-polyprenyl-6-methoxyphenol hydroxylase-like FAD-dependent oxidoreductase